MQTLYSEHPSMFRNNPLGFIGSVILVPVVIGAIILLVWYLRCKASKLVVTDNELLFEQGLLSKTRSELDMDSIRTVKVEQSFFNRMFGTGTIKLFTAGDKPEITAVGMPDPDKVRQLIKAGKNDDD